MPEPVDPKVLAARERRARHEREHDDGIITVASKVDGLFLEELVRLVGRFDEEDRAQIAIAIRRAIREAAAEKILRTRPSDRSPALR
jgi:hypothetical protein